MSTADLDRIYGRPATSDGKLDRNWYRRNIVPVELPFTMRAAWQKSIRVRTILFHRKKAADLVAALRIIWRYARLLAIEDAPVEPSTPEEYDALTIQRIQSDGLDLLAGAYCFRQRRDGRGLSEHARGIAIDIDPAGNPPVDNPPVDNPPVNNAPGSDATRTPDYAVRAFRKRGFAWGGEDEANENGMHFQAVE